MNMPIINLLIIVVFPLLVVSVYYGIGFNLIMRFADPAFDIRKERIYELIVGYFIASLLAIVYLTMIKHHFSLSDKVINNQSSLVIPCCIYVVIRSIVKMQSARVARDHINMVIFICLVSTALNCVSIKDDMGMIFSLPHVDWSQFTLKLLFNVIVLSIIVPLSGEYLFFYSKEIKIVNKYLIKEKRLIDLTEELPINLNFISGRERIDKKIKDILTNNQLSCLRILTNTYNTIEENFDILLNRCKSGTISIIGSNPNDCVRDVSGILAKMNESGMVYCFEKFDGIRVIIGGEQCLLASFATTGNKGSHVAIYSEHPFVISLFMNYFDAKCQRVPCGGNKVCHIRHCTD